MLAALLLMSGSPNQTAQRGIDTEMRYLKDLDALLAETIEATWAGKADTKDTLYELADRYEFILKRLGNDVATVYAPDSPVAGLRNSLSSRFGDFSRGYEPQQDQALALYGALAESGRGAGDFIA